MGRDLFFEGDDFGEDFVGGEGELAEGDGKLEAARTRAARVEIEDAGAGFLSGNVAVAGDDDAESGGFGLEVELREIVENVDGNAAEF